MTGKIGALGLLVVAASGLGGCLVVSGKSVDESGHRITSRTLGQVEIGVTTEAWVRATLGEPSDWRTVEGQEHVRILAYRHTVRKSEGGAVFLIFAGGSESKRTTTAYFEITEGVVTKYWVEE